MDFAIENNYEDITNFTFYVTPVSNELAFKLLKILGNGVIPLVKIPEKIRSSIIIKEGEHLFTYRSLIQSLAEQPKLSNEEGKVYTLEDQKYLRKENYEYFSKTDGILLKYNKLIRFIPVNYDAFCEIQISESKEFVTASFYPAVFSGKPLTGEMVIRQIRELKISADIELQILKKAIGIVNSRKQILSNVVVVKSKPSRMGKEGWVEYLFNKEHKVTAVVDEHGHTDFHNRNLLESVSENQIVAIFHPSVQGEDGINVFSEKILVPKVKEVKPPRGENIYQSDDNPNHILSKVDGYITLVGDNIVINDLYNVRGDVDFNTGHLVSKGSLNVHGNVVTGFNLDMSKDIKINGYVNDSDIIAGGNVSIQGGFTGTGLGKIVSGGNVCARYIRNQTVYSRGTITIDKEVVDAKLFAKNDITYRNKEAVIVGGRLMAGGNVNVSCLGNEYSVPTILEVGYDYDLLKKINELDVVLINLKKEIAFIKSQFDEHMSKNFLVNFQNKNKEYEELVNKRKKYQQLTKVASDSKVTVTGEIYPGVKIIINGRNLEVKELMNSKIFMYSDKEDCVVAIDK